MASQTYHTVMEAAQKLRLHPQTLRRWMREGKGLAKRVGRQWRLSAEYIERPSDSAAVADRFALAALAELWDNEEDAIYGRWKELYGVQEG